MLTPADVGRRVVVRRRLEVEAGRQLYGDVLGDLISWSDGVLVVRKRDGSLVSVDESAVVAGKPVPPPPPPRAPHTGEALARVAASGWPALEVEQLGDWLLQAADGYSGRANSVQASGWPGMAFSDALAAVRSFYAARGLPAWFQVVVGSAQEAELRSRGWVVQASGKSPWATTEVFVCPLSALLARLASVGVPASPAVELGGLDEEWLSLYGRGESPAARHVITGGSGAGQVPVGLARMRDADGGVIAIGRGVVTGPWLGLSAIEVVPEQRRRGYARAIMDGLGRWGAAEGAEWAYLQFGEENAAARALYEGLGFRPDHQYRYYAAPED